MGVLVCFVVFPVRRHIARARFKLSVVRYFSVVVPPNSGQVSSCRYVHLVCGHRFHGESKFNFDVIVGCGGKSDVGVSSFFIHSLHTQHKKNTGPLEEM